MTINGLIICFIFLLMSLFVIVLFLGIELHKTKQKINETITDNIMDWYNMNLSVGECKNRIECLENYLKMKYPNMDRELMAKYAHLDEQKSKKNLM